MLFELAVVMPQSHADDLLDGIQLNTLSRLTLLTGVNGAGKSTFMRGLLALCQSSHSQSPQAITTTHLIGNPFIVTLRSEDFRSFLKSRFDFWLVENSNSSSLFFSGMNADTVRSIVDAFDKLYLDEDYFSFACKDLTTILKNSFGKSIFPKQDSLSNDQIQFLLEFLNLPFSAGAHAVLIPEKRGCPPGHFNHKQSTCLADGTHLAEHLFNLKSAPQDTISHLRYRKLQDAFKQVSGLRLDVNLQPAENAVGIFFSYQTKTGWIPMQSTGRGYEDLVVLLFWLTEPEIDFILVEEIEAHLHPRLLANLATFISRLDNKFCIASTHSPDLVRASVPKKVFWLQCGTSKNSGSQLKPRITATDKSSEASVLKELGFEPLEYFAAKLLVMTEGHTDEIVIREFLRQMGHSPLHDVCFMHLGGDGMVHVNIEQWKSQFDIIALVDADPKSKSARDKFIEKCKISNVSYTKLKRYSLENYFSPDAYRCVFPALKGQIPSSFVDAQSIEKQIMFNPKGNIEALAQNTVVQNLIGTDLHNFLLALVEKMHQIQKSSEADELSTTIQ